MTFVLREWQQAALERCKELDRSIVEACPAAGKSAFSGGLAKHWLDTDACDHVLAVVPSISIRRGIYRQWRNNWGLRVKSGLLKKSGLNLRPPTSFDASVLTYHELHNDQCIELLQAWTAAGWRFSVVFDEIHHAADRKTWGDRVRTIGHDLANRVCIMTGTPFRTDERPITLMEYIVRDGEHVAAPDFRYVYRQAVADDVCRPVTCRWHDGSVKLFNAKHPDRGIIEKAIGSLNAWEMQEGTRLFFDPNGESMKNLVRCVDADLMRLRSHERYCDAAALFVCRPSKPNEQDGGDRHVLEMAALIKRVTGHESVVVTHDDKESANKIDAFTHGQSPYLVAVNMVSEGVDIPRLRKVAFCRYTDSEMLFRQIVGRVIRKTLDRDQVASEVYVPPFKAMKEFAERLWGEAKAGMLIRGDSEPSAELPDDHEPQFPASRNIIGIDATGDAAGGLFDEVDVDTHWIGVAEEVIRTHTGHRHWNQTHLGAVLKTANELSGSLIDLTNEQQRRSNLCDRLNRLVKKLARWAYGSNIGVTWNKCVFDPNGVANLEDIKAGWTHDKIEAVIKDVEHRIEAALNKNGGDHGRK